MDMGKYGRINEDGAVTEADDSLAQKVECEFRYWANRYRIENRHLRNSHYAIVFTEPFNISGVFFKGKKVLDIGCGPRGSLEWMFQARARVCVEPLTDDYAQFGTNDHSMVYIRSGVESIPLLSQSFDIVTSINNFDHVSDEEAGLREVVRVLRPGGTFLIIVEINTKPKRCEPKMLGWGFGDRICDHGMTRILERHFESVNDTFSFRHSPFNHDNPRVRNGFLVGMFQKRGL